MFYVYNIETKSVEKVEKINKAIHRHRNTKEEFTFVEEKVESKKETVVQPKNETPVKKSGRSKK